MSLMNTHDNGHASVAREVARLSAMAGQAPTKEACYLLMARAVTQCVY
jgi:hypothetical protein